MHCWLGGTDWADEKSELSKDTPSASSSFAHSSAWSVPPEKAAASLDRTAFDNGAHTLFSQQRFEGGDLEPS